MNLIEAGKLVFEYITRDKDGNVDGIIRALDGVDLHIAQGDFVAILGANGSGKTTLAKHLNALLAAGEGTLWIDGKDAADAGNAWDIRKSVGMVFQNPDDQIVAGVVEEDVAFGPENLGVPPLEILTRVSRGLHAVGMESCRKRSPNRLSGGQKQRVAIAGVLAMEPKCIVLDEPTAMLDPSGREEVLAAAESLNREKGITVILITHSMEEALRAGWVYVMDQGRIAMQGTPRKVFSDAGELRRHHLDVPRMALLADELRKAGVGLPEGILTRQELLEALCRLS